MGYWMLMNYQRSWMKRLAKFNDKYYVIVRTVRVDLVNGNMEGLKAWRDLMHCDHVLQQKDMYLLVQHVDDVEFEEI